MTSGEFRVLLIDDDGDMLQQMSERLSGISVAWRKETIGVRVDVLRVFVGGTRESPGFSTETLTRFLEITRFRYDYIIADYSFASSQLQPEQWNEGSRSAAKLESNAHLLTLVDFRDFLVSESRRKSIAEGKRGETFFSRTTPILLRSFQHDRVIDKLGSYESRVEASRGVFPKAKRIDRLDGFSQIYGSDPELREELYHGSTNGRRLYRNAVIAITIATTRAEVISAAAMRGNLPPVVRSTNLIALLVVAVAALAAVVQLVAGPMIDAAEKQSWLTFGALALVTLVFAYLGSFLIALLVERGVRRIIGGRDDGEA